MTTSVCTIQENKLNSTLFQMQAAWTNAQSFKW